MAIILAMVPLSQISLCAFIANFIGPSFPPRFCYVLLKPVIHFPFPLPIVLILLPPPLPLFLVLPNLSSFPSYSPFSSSCPSYSHAFSPSPALLLVPPIPPPPYIPHFPLHPPLLTGAGSSILAVNWPGKVV